MAEKFDVKSVVVSNDSKPDEIQQIYDKFATTYDKDIDPNTSYPSVNRLTETFVKTVGDADKNIRIMDLGAGTGHAALILRKYGFTNIDGLDLSPEMLKKAKEKNAYKNYICEAITEKRLDIETGTYDAVISAGAITSGYIKANAFNEILRLVKPGGYIVFTIRHDTFDNDEFGYAAKFQKFIDDGKWIQIEKYLTDYVIGYSDTIKNCFIVSYKVLKNE